MEKNLPINTLKHTIQNTIPEHSLIMVGVLNWGLGHATRCIPLIEVLIELGHTVQIASNGVAYSLLKNQFPDLRHYTIPTLEITYPSKYFWINFFANAPKILFNYMSEKRYLNHLVKKENIQVNISDNRIGWRNKKINKNIYITHQVNIFHKNKNISKLMSKIHQFFIHKYDECWIPDSADKRLAGMLSDARNFKKFRYIGFLSQIKKNLGFTGNQNYDICVLLSGPEPQRTSLENLLLPILNKFEHSKIILVRGTQSKFESIFTKNITVVGLANRDEISTILQSSKILIARSGYTTLMDIQDLHLKTVFIPTPGQTEQEYLAKIQKGMGEEVKVIFQKDIEKKLGNILASLGNLNRK